MLLCWSHSAGIKNTIDTEKNVQTNLIVIIVLGQTSIPYGNTCTRDCPGVTRSAIGGKYLTSSLTVVCASS